MLEKHFTKIELQTLHEAIISAEAKTSGEIIPMVVGHSASYASFHAIAACLGLLLASGAFFLLYPQNPWWSFADLFLWQASGAVSFFVLSEINLCQRLLLPKSWQDREVKKSAFANFLALGLSHTKHRNGILIYISRLERKVQILADTGIHEKVSESFWQSQSDAIAAGIAKGDIAKALCSAIQEISKPLCEHYPKEAGSKNEFNDDVREKPLL